MNTQSSQRQPGTSSGEEEEGRRVEMPLSPEEQEDMGGAALFLISMAKKTGGEMIDITPVSVHPITGEQKVAGGVFIVTEKGAIDAVYKALEAYRKEKGEEYDHFRGKVVGPSSGQPQEQKRPDWDPSVA